MNPSDLENSAKSWKVNHFKVLSMVTISENLKAINKKLYAISNKQS